MRTLEPDPDLERDLVALSKAPIVQLRERWRLIFKSEPPPAFGPDLLRRSIAQKLQEHRYGGLSGATLRQLNRISKAIADDPACRIELPRQIKSGAVLVRTWQGKAYQVTVLDDGFSFDGKTYQSLSLIAREITGTRWNGPRFFGLRPQASAAGEKSPTTGKNSTSPDMFERLVDSKEAANGRQ